MRRKIQRSYHDGIRGYGVCLSLGNESIRHLDALDVFTQRAEITVWRGEDKNNRIITSNTSKNYSNNVAKQAKQAKQKVGR